MTKAITHCQIWGEGNEAEGYREPTSRVFHVENSPRAAGGYVLSETAKNTKIDNLSSEQKARLTTWLVDQRKQGDQQPTITEQVIDYAIRKPPMSAYDRAVRLLGLLVESAGSIGSEVWLSEDAHAAFAYSESTSWAEINFLAGFLEDMGWISREYHQLWSRCILTVAGHSHIAEQATNLDVSQAFVAMWFDPCMEEVYDTAVRPAIEEAGYNPMRIDRKEHINKIDDEIIAEIRKSRFLVADFTHGEDGARGGVYYEAGFAHGLGIPVIFTCREDAVDTLHFDTNHYNHIVWTTPEELRERLKNRILSVIGEGPRTHISFDSSDSMVIP